MSRLVLLRFSWIVLFTLSKKLSSTWLKVVSFGTGIMPRMQIPFLNVFPVFQTVTDYLHQHFYFKRFCQVGICSILITADETLFIISCREQDNGNMADRNIFFDVYAQLVSVHPRHHHIADNDIRNVTFDKLESLHPISGNDYPFERLFQCLF